METVYREYSSARWNFWTYAEGKRVTIDAKTYRKMVDQGAKSVTVK